MSEQGLDDANIGAALEHVGGTGMTEQVTGAGTVDARFLQEALDPCREGAPAKAFTLIAEEQRGFSGSVL